jgi:outer membrane receptor for ferrienterochelin and colicins
LRLFKRIRKAGPLLALALAGSGWGILPCCVRAQEPGELVQNPVYGIAQDTAWVRDAAVVVTGEFSPAAQRDALRQVQLIGPKTMEGMAALTGRDVLRNALGLQMSEDAILGSGISVQGLRGENVKVLIDGVPVIGRLNGNIDLSQINLADVSRVELVEGPMSVEYGSNALAGTINFITDQSRGPRKELSTHQRYESVGQYTSAANASWGRGGNFIRLGAQRNYFDGWSPGEAGLDWVQDFVADENRVNAWNPKLQHDVSLSGQCLGVRSKWTPAIRLFSERIEDRGAPRAPYSEWALDNRYETRRASASLGLKTYKDDRTLWDVVAAWNGFERRKSSFRTDLTTLESTPLADPSTHDTTKVELWMMRGSINCSPDSRIQLRSGWDLAHESFAGPRVEGGLQQLSNAATFTLARYATTSGRATHQLGLRWAWNSAFAAPLLPSWHTLLTGERLRWRFSYARGFRAPSLKELHFVFVDVNHQLLGNPDLTAESSHNLQCSVSHAPAFSGTTFLSWQVSGFYNAVRNQIDFVQSGGDNRYVYRNIGQFKSHGARLSLSREASSWSWRLGAAWTAQSTDIASSQNKPYTHTPEITAQGSWSPVERVKLFTSLKYNGFQLRYFEATDELGELTIGSSRMEPFTFADATASYSSRSGAWVYTVGVRNALDVQDVAIAGASSGSGPAHGGDGMAMMAWGRSMVASVRWTLTPSKP